MSQVSIKGRGLIIIASWRAFSAAGGVPRRTSLTPLQKRPVLALHHWGQPGRSEGFFTRLWRVVATVPVI